MPKGVLTRRERAAARLVTGPLAHLYAGALDWLQLAGTLLRGRFSR